MTRFKNVVVMGCAAGLLLLTASTQAAAQVSAAPVKGLAELGTLAPKQKLEGSEVVTTIEFKNLSKGSIVGLEVAEFWWDKNNNPVQGTGDRQRMKKPLQPGEIGTLVLHSPRVPAMVRSNYQFTHANGQIKLVQLQSLK